MGEGIYRYENEYKEYKDYKSEYDIMAYRYFYTMGQRSLLDLCIIFNTSWNGILKWIDEHESFKNSIINGYEDYPKYEKIKLEKRKRKNDLRKTEKQRKIINEYTKKRLRENPAAHIRSCVSSLIRHRVKSKNRKSCFQYLNYSVGELMDSLEDKFVDGMTWDNYGKVWHIDHVIPDSWFKYESMDDKEFKKCWSLNNLQPLFVADNLRKGNRYAG